MNKLPRFFFNLLLFICILFSFLTIFKQGVLPSIPIELYFIWVLSEFYISKRDSSNGTGNADNGTVVVYGYGRVSHVFVTIAVFLLYSLDKSQSILHLVVGASLITLGIVIRKVAIATLGRHYSHLIDMKSDHKIIKKGIYKYIRHPAYAGMILASLGLTIAYYSVPSLLFLVLVLTPSIMFRIHYEEKALKEIKGYEDYSLKVKRLIPFIY